MARQLSAGVARTDITPPPGIAHAGWGAQTHQRAAGVDLPLWATALALSDGDQAAVIVDIDLIYIWEEEAPGVLQAVADLTGLPPSHIRLAYTHTHSGPVNGRAWTRWMKAGAEMAPAYDQSLPSKIAGVAWQALNRLRPVRLAAGAGQCAINVNRRFQRPEDGAVICGRNWEGPVDHEVKVLRLDSLDGEPVAAVVNYACHPITVGPDCELITPDYPGAMKRVVEQATGATCLFLQGAAGDVGPRRGVARGGLHEYKRLGAILGHEASRVWWELASPPRRERYMGTLESGSPLAVYADEPLEEADATLRAGTRTVNLPLKQLPPPDSFEAAFTEHNAELNRLRESNGSPEAIARETMLCKRAAMRADLARQLHGRAHRAFELQAFTIGDEVALVAVPGEPFVEIGLRVKQASPFKHTLFSGYSNVGWAYIPTPEAYPLGGYEIEVTPFTPDVAGLLVEESLALLHSLSPLPAGEGGRRPGEGEQRQ
jgi:hypothetical protein